MIEIVTQAGDDERETFDFTKDFPPLRSLGTMQWLQFQFHKL